MKTWKLTDGRNFELTGTNARGENNVILGVEGWYGAPTRLERTERLHDGEFIGQLWRNAREMTMRGYSTGGDSEDPCLHFGDTHLKHLDVESFKRALAGAFWSGDRGIGTISEYDDDTGLLLESYEVQLDGPPSFEHDSFRQFSWEIPLLAGDPHLYGNRQSAQLATEGIGVGLEFPLFDDEDTNTRTGILEFNSTGGDQSFTMYNSGNARAYPVFIVKGTFPSGFKIVMDGKQIVYQSAVYPQSPVTVDMRGQVLINDVDHSSSLTLRQWAHVDPGEYSTARLIALSNGDGWADAIFRPTYL